MAVAVEVVAVVMMMMMKERKAACSLVVRIERMIARAKEGGRAFGKRGWATRAGRIILDQSRESGGAASQMRLSSLLLPCVWTNGGEEQDKKADKDNWEAVVH